MKGREWASDPFILHTLRITKTIEFGYKTKRLVSTYHVRNEVLIVKNRCVVKTRVSSIVRRHARSGGVSRVE